MDLFATYWQRAFAFIPTESKVGGVSKASFQQRKVQYLAFGNLFGFILVFGGILLGFYLYGLVGALIMIACRDVPKLVPMYFGLWKEKLLMIGQDLQVTLVLILLLVCLIGLRFALGYGIPFSA